MLLLVPQPLPSLLLRKSKSQRKIYRNKLTQSKREITVGRSYSRVGKENVLGAKC